MTTKTKMLSTDSDSSSRYAAKYSVAALLPWVAATHSPTASPSPTHRMTHAMFRDEEPPALVFGRRTAGRFGSGDETKQKRYHAAMVPSNSGDSFRLPGKSFELQVMGTFEVRDGK